MHLCGQQPSDEQLQLIQEKVRYWRQGIRATWWGNEEDGSPILQGKKG